MPSLDLPTLVPPTASATPSTALTSLEAGSRAVARCDALGVAPYSDAAGGLFRAWLSPAHRAALDPLRAWMGEAGMSVRMDALGSLIGRYEGSAPGARALLIGSHIDSVRDAGRYDGPLGIMLGIECVASLHANRRRLPFAIEVIAFGDEEGSRFPASMFCSRGISGTLDPTTMSVSDATGTDVATALRAWNLDIADVGSAAYRPESVIGYLEAHIEQGPVLEAENLPIGVVTGIAAQLRFNVAVLGRAGHAGTTTMPLRADALTAAAECVLAAERIARAGADDLVATVGRMQVLPGATNVVPGRVEFSLDVRAGADAIRDAAAAEISAQFSAIASARGIVIDMQQVQDLPASPCDAAMVDQLEQAVQAQDIPARRLVSGAGHDAMVMAALCPTAMLFVRCAGGISHNPAESVDPADVGIAQAAMLDFIERFGEHLGN